jgi:hypothetical protein
MAVCFSTDVASSGNLETLVPTFFRRELFWWSCLVMVVVALLLTAFFLLPGWMVHERLSPADTLKARDDIRATAVQTIAAIAVAMGTFLTARTYLLARKGQLSDRLTKAIDLLGNADASSRIGGISALEAISQEAPEQHWAVMEQLAAFVRERADWSPGSEMGRTPDRDVQTALAVLGRRDTTRDPDDHRLDLHGTDLRQAVLREGKFARTSFTDAHLEGAILTRTDLREALLNRAVLDGADLTRANLEDAKAFGASMRGATLRLARMRDADLGEAVLYAADLTDAVGANLHPARVDTQTIWPDGTRGGVGSRVAVRDRLVHRASAWRWWT